MPAASVGSGLNTRSADSILIRGFIHHSHSSAHDPDIY